MKILKTKILILGGTKFVGRHVAEVAVSRGHDVTLFNRGHETAPEGVVTIIGDRLTPEGYSGLRGLSFDTVIDTWFTDPIAVKLAVDALRGRIGQYIYISSVSVYNFEEASVPYSESTPLFDPEKASWQYAKDKIRGEQCASESGVPTTLVRPGIILGPYEDVWRLPWWLRRLKTGGPTLAPSPKDLALQFIDGRDLAKFVVHAAEKKIEGPFNLVSELNHMSMADFLETVNEVTGEHAKLCWLESKKLLEAGIRQGIELPMWVTLEDSEIYSIDTTKASKAGLKIRPAKETIVDTWEWVKTLHELPPDIRVGLDPEKERETLKKYCGIE